MMTNDDERGEGVKDAQNLMTSQVDDPFFCPRHGQRKNFRILITNVLCNNNLY